MTTTTFKPRETPFYCPICGERNWITSKDILDNYWSYCGSCGSSPWYPNKIIVGVDAVGAPIFRGK